MKNVLEHEREDLSRGLLLVSCGRLIGGTDLDRNDDLFDRGGSLFVTANQRGASGGRKSDSCVLDVTPCPDSRFERSRWRCGWRVVVTSGQVRLG
jgi:hypothetical protein